MLKNQSKMLTEYKLDKSFGPVGTVAGTILFLTGLITTYTSAYGLILILIGAFVGFTSTSTIIDFAKRRIKFSNNLFGVFRSGKWLQIEGGMKAGIKDSHVNWTSYSAGNRPLDIAVNDFRISLLDEDNNEILEIMKCKTLELAKVELASLCSKLGLMPIG